MRLLIQVVPGFAALAALLALAPLPAQAAAAVPAVASVQSQSVQLVAENCGRHRHRVWRHHRAYCVHN